MDTEDELALDLGRVRLLEALRHRRSPGEAASIACCEKIGEVAAILGHFPNGSKLNEALAKLLEAKNAIGLALLSC